MAFKRSAVRSRLSPPSPEIVRFQGFFFASTQSPPLIPFGKMAVLTASGIIKLQSIRKRLTPHSYRVFFLGIIEGKTWIQGCGLQARELYAIIHTLKVP